MDVWKTDVREIAKKKPPTYIFTLVLVVAAFGSGFYIGGEQNVQLPSPLSVFTENNALAPRDVDFTPLWKAWNIIESKYVPASTTDTITNEERVYGAIQGLAKSLGDPYTVFLPPQEASIFEEDISGNFGGVGIEIGIRGSILTVIAPLKGTPADKAGIQTGDKILEIDGESAEGITVEAAVVKIRGESGTPVALTIGREGEAEFLTISIVRSIIEIPTIETELRGDTIFVIRLFNFSAISPGLFRGALREFVEAGTDKLILDLRGNPGGFLEAAIDMASWFLPTGEVVVTEDFGEDIKERVHRSKGYNVFDESLKMVVLVNQGSASASEILAGALKEHGVATIIGTQTFGKGSVQELLDVTENTSLKVTIARWLTPNGTSISDGGLTPDILVEIEQEDIEELQDPQLDRAVEFLLKQ